MNTMPNDNSDINKSFEKSPTKEELAVFERNHHLLGGNEASREQFPRMGNISAGFIFRFIPRPKEALPAEFVSLPSVTSSRWRTKTQLAVTEWNVAWEAAQLRRDWFGPRRLPLGLRRVVERTHGNVYFVRETEQRYHEYAALYHLLPRRVLERNGLPLLRSGTWPEFAEIGRVEKFLPHDYETRLSRAFASYLWSRLLPGSGINCFSRSDPIKLLAHNLDFWLPPVTTVMEDILRTFPRVEPDDDEQRRLLERARREVPDGVIVDRPRKGGDLWRGEDDASEVADWVVETADSGGRLRAIIDAVKSNRVEDDFSARWSYAREDFERKLYHKRAKVSVRFVELTDNVPFQGPSAEVDQNLVFKDFMALLDPRERRVIVLLQSGVTRLGDVASLLGYKNHSPVSKTLARIRRKASNYFGLN